MPKTIRASSGSRIPASTYLLPGKLSKSYQLPRRCNRCEGRPILTRCEHTKVGRMHLQSEQRSLLNSQNAVAPSASTGSDNHFPTPAPEHPVTQHTLPVQTSTMSGTETFLTDTPHQSCILTARYTPPPLESIGDTASILPVSSDQPINGIISGELNPSRVSDPQSAAFPQENEQESESSRHSVPIVLTHAKRPRATAANPVYGRVEGVYRGKTHHSIHRGHVLPKRINDGDKCQRHFLEASNSIIAKCEDLASLTGCWLFVGMQHATARGAPLHYASPRIREEAPDAISDFSENFCTMMNNLADARRRETSEVQQNLQAVEMEKTKLEMEVAALRSENGLLRRYKEMSEL